MTDPYSFLGVTQNASDDEITRAYRSLARKYHPDLNPGDKRAESNMKNINAAYAQIQDIRSGKSPQSAAGWGSDPSSTGTGSQNRGEYGYSPFEPFYGGTFWYGTENNSRRYSSRRYTRRRSPASFGLFNFPFARFILVIIILRFVINIIFSMLFAFSGQSDYPQQSSDTIKSEYFQTDSVGDSEEAYKL